MAEKLDVPAAAIAGCHCLAMRQAARRVTHFYDGVLAPTGLRTTQFSILATLYDLGPTTINDLADALALDRTTLGRNIQPLQREGLIAVERGNQDRRSKQVQVTQAGATRLKTGVRLWSKAQTQLEAAFGPQRMSAMRALLAELRLTKLRV